MAARLQLQLRASRIRLLLLGDDQLSPRMKLGGGWRAMPSLGNGRRPRWQHPSISRTGIGADSPKSNRRHPQFKVPTQLYKQQLPKLVDQEARG